MLNQSDMIFDAMIEELQAWRKAFPGFKYQEYTGTIEKAKELGDSRDVPRCCVCGTTTNLHGDGWYGYRCNSSKCDTF